MKYAAVRTDLAQAMGIDCKNKVKSKDESLMLVNENELKLYGDPATVAAELGGELVDRQALNKILISILKKTWTK